MSFEQLKIDFKQVATLVDIIFSVSVSFDLTSQPIKLKESMDFGLTSYLY